METIYRERDLKVNAIMTGAEIWAAGQMGCEVTVHGVKQKPWEMEMRFRKSVRKWNVILSYLAGEADPEVNVQDSVFK
jgi:hypothetical protein